MATPREHIEEIRRKKFSIGGEENALSEDLHHAVRHLSAELYTKDVHFLMELIQNAEDNQYEPDVEPSLEFVVTSRDVTGVGAPATLLVFNNEKGFTPRNIESLCSVGRSTKKGKRQGGYIGEKGIGFKSVFLITNQPYIFSNGYKIRFNETPPSGIKIGYIVPEWIDKPSVEDLKKVYGSQCKVELPNTVIILPLRAEKVEGVKDQLAHIHPEVILFMSKIKRLSVREDVRNQNPRVNAVSVSQEIAFQNVNEGSESFSLRLSAEENGKSNGECSYYMWRQRFPVKSNNRIEERRDIANWGITLAFPREDRVTTGNRVAAGIYAFLPTEIVTGLPFIIQADFLLASSRESILWDNKWNQGILDCISSAFCEAFLSFVRSATGAARTDCFRYLPINIPSHLQLRRIREEIQAKLRTEEVILCEPENAYCMPNQARKILPGFRKILEKATEKGLEKPSALWSTGVFIIHSCLDNSSSYLDFLGVGYVPDDWYFTCIRSTPGWLMNLSEDLYVQLLCFIAEHWNRRIPSSLQQFPLFKFDNGFYGVGWASLSDMSSKGTKIYFSLGERDITWLTKWNKVLGSAPRYKFLSNATQMAMKSLSYNEQSRLREWLDRYANITELSVSSFSKQLLEEAKTSRSKEFIIHVAQFLHFSSVSGCMDSIQMLTLCKELPVVSELESIVSSCKAKLVPASMGKWHKLMGDNPWAGEGIVALSPAYMKANASGLEFMRNVLGAVDIPKLKPPDAPLPAVSSPIGEDRVVLLLEWIQYLTGVCNESLPNRFLSSIMEGKWLRTHRGYESPNKSFFYDTEWSLAGLKLNDLSFIDCSFYKRDMNEFKNALQRIGVVVEFGMGCEIVAKMVQIHTDFEVITRLYKYLHHCHWRPSSPNSLKIWIPHSGGLAGEWKDSKMCVVHDDNGLFYGRLQILERFYEDTLLPFFSSYLGVSLHPKIEEYCNLWLDWIRSNHVVTEPECCSVWRNILKHWSESPSTIKRLLRKQGLKFPAHTSSGHIQVCAPNETFIPDDLSLKELFKEASTKVKFAWHPNPSDPKIPLDLLFSMYESLGARKLSEAVEKKEASVSSDNYLHRLQAGEGLFRKGLYIIILGYLAYPSFKLSADRRHQIVRTLLESLACEAAKPFTVMYTLTIITEDGETEHITVAAQSCVRWEKDSKRILIQKSDPHNQKEKWCLATEFAEVISKGLLSEHPDLVAGLCEMLKLGCMVGFVTDVVNAMLQQKNLLIFKEDESFLSGFFPIEDPLGQYQPRRQQESARKRSGTSAGQARSPQNFGTSAGPATSAWQFSPDFIEGWEKRVQIFRQAIENMKYCTPASLKSKLVKMLFPSQSSDKGQPETSSGFHLMKVAGDACLKILTVSEVLGANESCQMVPFKLENLLGDEVLELGKRFGRGGTTQKPHVAADGVDQCDFEMLKAIAGAAALKFLRGKN
ncbi:hypothetical protein SUGI_0966750 [Cryptomeria japonica]|uniref:uncharacterized protein LOC131046098 n=1 Tax=Cryptomeria japonica TaxID=3369 RepID=UPI0024147897|nr:uncharacterized protein LOC131046098 [Cryptomeria japonica]GLJ45914.1 hypothetical protein SUGI_0966750 [Cryptomeria japonica]